MRQLHNAQRGSANWAFIITLLIMLAFVYLWWTEKDAREAAEKATATAEVNEAKAEDVARGLATWGRDLSKVIGWDDKRIGSIVTDANLGAIANKIAAGDDFFFTDVARVKAQLEPDGMNPDGSPGLLNQLDKSTIITIQREMRRKGADGVKVLDVDFKAASPELREKLKQINESLKNRPPVPTPVSDPDDAADVARHEAESAAFDKWMAEFGDLMDEFQGMPGAKQFTDVIKGPGTWEPDKMDAIQLDFFERDLTGKVRISDIVTYPPKIIELFKQEFTSSKKEDQAVIVRLQADAEQKSGEISDLQGQLEQEQQARNTDVENLRNDLAQANEKVEQNRREATQAQNELAQVTDAKEEAVTERDTQIRALEERIRLDKAVRNLEIQRNDPDGHVLASTPRMGTASIDLGTADKVYPGLKFDVSRIGRGGVRELVGQVQVIRVTGQKQARVRVIETLNPRSPVLGGDFISNPFFNATAPIHLVIAGELETFPMEVIKARLDKMGVTVQPLVNGKTDYIVVPDAVAMADMAKPGTDEEEDEEEEGSAGAKSEYERLQSEALRVGATVITERMLNNFLGL